METACQQEPSQEQHPLMGEVPTAACSLASLLDDEPFLLLVFEHLVEHGLQNCRLVCRRWYEACKQFPVELKGVVLEPLEMIDAFPNATSVSSRDCPTTPVNEMFERLSSLNSLKSLTVIVHSVVPSVGSAVRFLQSMDQLTDLWLVQRTRFSSDNLVEAVKQLTSLTRLHLRLDLADRQQTPFATLRKIQDLEVNANTLFGVNDTFLFPSLTNLTRLSFEVYPGGVSVLFSTKVRGFFQIFAFHIWSLGECLAGNQLLRNESQALGPPRYERPTLT